jgi:hypothetical protein
LGELVTPLAQALWVNHRFHSADVAVPAIRRSDWTAAELDRLTEQSHDRLRSIEAKGPGLATVSAVVGAAIGLAITATWDHATGAQRTLLVASAVYTFVSLICPIMLVGSVQRSVITLDKLAALSDTPDGEMEAFRVKVEAIAENDRHTNRLANLQTACSYDLRDALVLLAVWGVTLLCS